MLYDRLPHRLHSSLNAYLDRADAFDYVQFKKVYDLTDCNVKLRDILAHGGFCMDPRKNLGMGVLKVVETTDNSIDECVTKLRATAKVKAFIMRANCRAALRTELTSEGAEPMCYPADRHV